MTRFALIISAECPSSVKSNSGEDQSDDGVLAGSAGLDAVMAMFNTVIHPAFGSGSERILIRRAFTI